MKVNTAADQLNADLRKLEEEHLAKWRKWQKENMHPPILFVAVDRVIMYGKICVGRMKSRNFAIRTANALNEYTPNKKGV